MNIVYIVPEMSHPGGIGRVTAIKANHFAATGNDVTIITEIQGKNSFYYELNDNIKHYDIGLSECQNKILKFFIRIKRLKNLLENIKPNIVIYTYFVLPIHCSFQYVSILECHFNHDVANLMAQAFNTSLVKAKYITKYYEYIASKADILVVLTDQDKKLWKDSCKKTNIIRIPNMNSFSSEQTSKLNNKKAIAVGRLDAQKGFDRLIAIWARVYNEHKDWQLNIYGKGPDRKKLEDLINTYGLNNSVFINDPVKNIRDKYIESSILCFTSTYEGWGLVITEAMSCGLPVIAYDIPCGPKDIIENDYNGFLVRDNDIEKYVKYLSVLMDDKTKRESMGMTAFESAQKYNTNIVMKQWDNLLEQIKKK
ncbi:glycosyltransferase family 4 protein [uncultured Prevotella sp.]|uniref:glycosyltransferase family 4 protein n=1 Tax=Xylanibacter rarus TaxID=1676614 RepID=UPI002672AFE1|nr:glycosyltransferase family 4 protein [uncultured Prevotella sp.]